MKELIVDRIENNKAVCENSAGEQVIIDLPPNCSEGDCLELTAEGYIVSQEKTKQRRERLQNLFNSLKKK